MSGAYTKLVTIVTMACGAVNQLITTLITLGGWKVQESGLNHKPVTSA